MLSHAEFQAKEWLIAGVVYAVFDLLI